MAVLATPPFLYFADANGNPLADGLVYTYAAGTDTPKATYTDDTGDTEMPNPIELDSAGRATWWLIGSYKYVVKDSLGNTISTTDNVTAFSTLAEQNDAFFQSFSGNGTQTAFTLSEDLGTEEKALMVFVNSGLQSNIANGNFATDTIWTKGAGWTIGAGVATAAGALSTAISQTATVALVEGQAYSVTFTITRSAGGLIPSIGGQAGTERTASGTYREVIIAGSSQTIAFTGNGFTGTLDDVIISVADSAGFGILAPTAFTVSGTALTFAVAPASGTNNIYVFAPSLLLGAASAAAAAAEASATAALTSEVNAAISASSAAAYAAAKNQWTFSSTTTMTAPGTANLRLNDAVLANVTQIAISDLSANSGNPDLGSWIDTWDNAGGSNAGSIFIFKDNGNFAIYNVNSTLTDNTTWHQVPVTYVASAGSFSNTDSILIGFAASGTTLVTGGINQLTGDVLAGPGSGSQAATLSTSITNKLTSSTRQTLTSGTAQTYTTPANVRQLKVRMIAGGGGGGGNGTTTTGGNGGTGGTTTFDTFTVIGGGPGTANNGVAGGTGGVGGTGGSGSASVRLAGGSGGGGVAVNASAAFDMAGYGGDGAFGGGGGGNASPAAGAANTGGGGAGASSTGVTVANSGGGGAGEYAELIINTPAASYTYTVGAGGTAGTAGTSGVAGKAGGSGIIIVDEYY